MLRDENERSWARPPSIPTGSSRVDVPTDQLGHPGPGRLSASLEGSTLLAPPISHAIERHARVELVVATPEPGGVPEDGIAIEVETRSSRGPVPTGSVEATVSNHSVGASPVRTGRAALLVTFASTRNLIAPAQFATWPTRLGGSRARLSPVGVAVRRRASGGGTRDLPRARSGGLDDARRLAAAPRMCRPRSKKKSSPAWTNTRSKSFATKRSDEGVVRPRRRCP